MIKRAIFILMLLATTASAADMRLQCYEAQYGAQCPDNRDTMNRLTLVCHNNDGTIKPSCVALTFNGSQGLATVPAGGSVAVTYGTALTAVTNVFLAPVGTTGRYASANSISVTGMTIYLFDVSGNPLAGDVYWKVEGY